MWLGSKLTLVSDSLFKSLFKVVFRYDIFISYARSDGKDYALKLRDQLKQLDFSCFLDFDELPPGNALNNTLKRAIKKSAALVIVGTERAVKSRYVELEVGEFSKTGRAIIPIDIEGTLVETPWDVIKERDIVWIDELNTALTRGVPSPTVADSIDKLFKYTRRNTRVRAQVLSTLVLFVVVVAVSLFMIQQKVKAANAASTEAERQKAEALTQKNSANEAFVKATMAEIKTFTETAIAAIAKKNADDSAIEAKKQEGIALANAARAKAEQARAEERTRYVQAQQMGAQADIARNTGEDLDRSVLLSIESLKGALTPEGYIAWERAMDLLPHPVEDRSGATKMWDRKTYKLPEGTNTFHAKSIAFSPDGRYAALAGPSTGSVLRVIDLAKGAGGPILEQKLDQVNQVMSVDFSPKGKWLALGCLNGAGRSQIMSWDVASFDKTDKGTPKTLGSLSEEGLRGTLKQISFSPNGNFLAVVNLSGSIDIWDISDDSETISATEIPQSQQAKGRGGVEASILAFSPDEKYIAAAPDQNTVGVWEVRSGREVSRIEHQKDIKSIAFSPDGRLLATIGEEIAFWKMEFGSQAQRIAANDSSAEVELKALAISHGWLAVASSDGAQVLRTADWKPVTTVLAPGDDLAQVIFSADGQWLITASMNKITAFDTKLWKGTLVAELDPNERLNKPLTISNGDKAPHIGFSPDGRYLAVTNGSRLSLFEYGGSWQPKAPTMTHSDTVRKVSFSPDGRWLSVEVADVYKTGFGLRTDLPRERTYVWEANTGLPVACRTDRDDYSQSEYAESERVDNRKARCPEIKANQQQRNLLSEVPNWKQILKTDVLNSTSPDGLWSVEVESGRDITLSLKDGKTTRRVAGLTPDGAVRGLAFSPDSRWLVIGSDKAVILWPLKPADMIDEACARLRRRDLTSDEWKQYFSGAKLQPTCSQSRP